MLGIVAYLENKNLSSCFFPLRYPYLTVLLYHPKSRCGLLSSLCSRLEKDVPFRVPVSFDHVSDELVQVLGEGTGYLTVL